jgi:hypothetical protein
MLTTRQDWSRHSFPGPIPICSNREGWTTFFPRIFRPDYGCVKARLQRLKKPGLKNQLSRDDNSEEGQHHVELLYWCKLTSRLWNVVSELTQQTYRRKKYGIFCSRWIRANLFAV